MHSRYIQKHEIKNIVVFPKQYHRIEENTLKIITKCFTIENAFILKAIAIHYPQTTTAKHVLFCKIFLYIAEKPFRLIIPII